ncbi:hypothetical protein CENSYa_0015 [Cenarchaeum symbiosum A]|uniref:Uncharacterized protein n=1 Tax=Cenarchaeum symbiosum (strain A) TaxID=414004 RepID=A0RTK6_CENSY|nr:hypothetical protein CENSYa_0015 [Cenarchaeum symbiosum A]
MDDVIMFYIYKDHWTDFCEHDTQASEICIETYWSGHGSHAYRQSDFSCYAYGADPVGNSFMIGYEITAERALECELIYPQIVSYWNHQLYGYTNEPIFVDNG